MLPLRVLVRKHVTYFWGVLASHSPPKLLKLRTGSQFTQRRQTRHPQNVPSLYSNHLLDFFHTK